MPTTVGIGIVRLRVQPNAYCNICNPFQYATDIMTNPALRAAHIQDTTQLHKDIKSGNLPAVTIVKPDGLVDGHPASSKLDLFEGFTKKIVDEVQDNRETLERHGHFRDL